MEQALSAAGIEATVLSTEDQIRGAPPLDHLQHLVVKVHGDYRDIRIRNTAEELARYPQEVNDLLDRIFNDYGLIVCGWSGEWDPALRAALERASARRYTTYWTTRSRPSEDTRALIARRSAEVVEIADANSFFEKLKEDVAAIDEFSRPHPLSADIAVTKLKRYLPEPLYRIQLADLIEGSVQEIIERTSGDAFSPNEPEPTPESIAKRLKAYDAACSTLTAMAAAGGVGPRQGTTRCGIGHYNTCVGGASRRGTPTGWVYKGTRRLCCSTHWGSGPSTGGSSIFSVAF